MPRPDNDLDPRTGKPWTTRQRLGRSLTRRFPRARRALDRLRGKLHGLRARLAFRLGAFGATGRWVRDTTRAFVLRRRERRLTVGVDVTSFWEPLTGVGWYLYRLLEAMADREDIALRLYGPTVVDSPDRPAPVVALPKGQAIEEVLLRVPERLLLDQGSVIRMLRRVEPVLRSMDGNDVLFAPNYLLPRAFGLSLGAQVATIHDLGSRLVPWSLEEETLEELEGRLERGIARADHLISVSAAVRDELADQGLADRDRVTVIHHGPGQLASVAPGELPAGVPDRFGLHVGTLEPRKNVAGLLAAWRVLRSRWPAAPPLVLCGRFGWRSEEIRSRVAEGVEGGWLLHLGYVEEASLAALYRHAAVVAFPTWYEGFGLPAVEAQHAGAPLVCSDLPVLREVAGEGALFASPDEPEAFATALERVLTNGALRTRLVDGGRRAASRLSWARSAQATRDVFAAVGGRSDGGHA